MKFIISFLLMSLLSFAACLYLPWWSITIVCFVISLLIRQHPGIALITGFLSLFILWAGLSFWISNNNGHILAHKVSLLILKGDHPYLLIIVTGLIGGIVASLAALAGSLLRNRPAAN